MSAGSARTTLITHGMARVPAVVRARLAHSAMYLPKARHHGCRKASEPTATSAIGATKPPGLEGPLIWNSSPLLGPSRIGPRTYRLDWNNDPGERLVSAPAL